METGERYAGEASCACGGGLEQAVDDAGSDREISNNRGVELCFVSTNELGCLRYSGNLRRGQ